MTKTRIALVSAAVLYSIFTLLPYKNWLRWNDLNLEPLPNIFYADSIYYIGKIRDISQGNYLVGNPIVYEHALDGFSYGDSSLFYFWGTLGRALDTNTIQTYLVMITVNSIFLILSMYSLLSIIQKKESAIFFSLLICVFLVEELGRPSPTQQLLPILIFAITNVLILTLKERDAPKRKIFLHRLIFSILAIVLISGNPLYSIFLFLVTLVALFLFPKSNKFCFCWLGILNLTYFVWNRVTFDEMDNLLGNRFGIHNTRIPGALSITVPLILVVIILFIVTNLISSKNIVASRVNTVKTRFYLAYSLALVFAVNSQVLTGRAYEMESHYILVWKILLGMILSELVLIVISRVNLMHAKSNLISNVLMLILAIQLIFSISQFKNIQTFSSPATNLLEELNLKSYKVVLIKNDSKLSGIDDDIIYHTNSYLYWHPYIVASKITQRNISARFACSQSIRLSFEEYKSQESGLYFHQYSNDKLKSEQLNKYSRLFGLKFKPFSYDKFLAADYNIYLQEQDFCFNGKFKFRVDKII